MDKCREEFENSLERTDGFHDGYVTWNEASGMYMANDDGYECMADWMNGAFAIHRKMQAKVEELQKRVQFLEQELGAWKGKSIAAMINGMCKQCGKEPWQAIVSDKDGYALLHCFGCGANKYELVGEQALKGEG
ncbi:hypothetical protein NRA10_10545 [Acinetobacter baumannii]|nr:hypothetical protein [Acinetobacter baumannii]